MLENKHMEAEEVEMDLNGPRESYEPPILLHLGSLDELTKTGASGAAEAGSQSANKKRASILA